MIIAFWHWELGPTKPWPEIWNIRTEPLFQYVNKLQCLMSNRQYGIIECFHMHTNLRVVPEFSSTVLHIWTLCRVYAHGPVKWTLCIFFCTHFKDLYKFTHFPTNVCLYILAHNFQMSNVTRFMRFIKLATIQLSSVLLNACMCGVYWLLSYSVAE